MKYKYFALDIDGTIFSSESIIYPTYREAIENFCRTSGKNFAIPDQPRIMLEIGKPVKTIFQNLFPELIESERDTISDSVLVLLCERIAKGEGEYYADVRATVEALLAREAKILVASNGRQPYIDAILKYLNILQYVQYPTYIDAKIIFSKSDILRAYVARGILPREILMVGDRLSDADAADAIGCDFAWCAYGHAPPGEITKYTLRLEKFSDLTAYA